ncbi:MAG: transporter permease [Proteobacteria bacterium]|nr:transporter permease [Pseudomonadota bacterium]
MMRGILHLAFRNVIRHRGRTLLTVASIVFGVVALILSGGFIEDTVVEVGESMIHSNSGHLQVNRSGYAAQGAQNLNRFIIDNPAELRTKLQAIPGVKDVLLRVGFSGLLNNGKADASIIGEGVEPDREMQLGSYLTISEGRQLKADDPFGILVGHGVARTLHLRPGDPVTLLVSTTGGASNFLEFQVVGVFQTFSKDYDARAVRIPLTAARELLDTQGAHTAVVALQQTKLTTQVAERVRQDLAPAGFELRTWIELNEFYTQTVNLYQQQFGFLVVIILIMLLLSVSNTVNMNIYERVSEFGTMLALGNRSRFVFHLIILEGAVLGLIGSILGVMIGIALALGISAVGIPMPPPPNADLGYVSRILVVPGIVAIAFCVGWVAAVLASVLPARKVSKMPAAEALRYGV